MVLLELGVLRQTTCRLRHTHLQVTQINVLQTHP
jgi:hypothetical protein